ncbi:Structural maintenance of chromosomes protein 4 [Rhizoctonia solani]|uniref:ATP-dependent DNA helicase n=1 Tax=Rhizoctonia solani TaxID=456999 RepID=A0A0K6FZ76_9AGAM|nr:Structural maintenance of chromosomes protein 4 [Rhizoctonia solani]
MRGNVTSFELSSEHINDMINGDLMPQDISVLASVLSVTMIAKRNTINTEALDIFVVHRELVQDALEWLKSNNPKYYRNIKIDRSRLSNLPVAGVPSEIYHNIRFEEETSNIAMESDGCTTTADEVEELEGEGFHLGDNAEDEDANPDVVPLQYLGVMDNDMSKVPTHELLTWGLQNTWKTNEDSEFGYAVRWGAPVNTFGQAPRGQPPLDPERQNYWECAFPLLYPYGVGGIEADRPVKLSLIEHARWALRHHDRRFRYHGTFMFVVFGIYQRRQALSSAKIQMRRKDFDSIARILDTITHDDLEHAKKEEKQGRKPSNPAIRTLKENITATYKRVVGSGPARVQLRSQIWSTSMMLNPPTLWVTINPDDLHDPLAQIFAGEDIDMDAFVETAGPSSNTRSENIARDPFAAGEFFNYIITIIIEKLFGVVKTASRVYSHIGILGRVKAYFGTVECQGRGTLHLHMLLWLHNAPPASQIQEMLRTSEFRSRVLAYIQSNVHSYHPLLSNPIALKSFPPNSEVAYSRPPHPSTPLDVLLPKLRQLEATVVHTKQIHKCVIGVCKFQDKHGKLVCKRRAPWELTLIYRTYPGLKPLSEHRANQSKLECLSEEETTIQPNLGEPSEGLGGRNNTHGSEEVPDSVILQFNDAGKLHHRSQVEDYSMRGDEANNYNILDYFVGTYEQQIHKAMTTALSNNESNADEDHASTVYDSSPHAKAQGRPRHQRLPYLPSHPRYSTHTRVVRALGHNTLPNIVGPQFARQSDPTQEEIYAISMLVLLKPWRSLSDLKSPEQSWSEALGAFVLTADQHVRDILDNIEHYHTCRTAAEEKQQASDLTVETGDLHEGFLTSEDLDLGEDHQLQLDSRDITEKMVNDLDAKAENQRDAAYGMHGVSIARAKGVFAAPCAPIKCVTNRATNQDILSLKQWQELLKKEIVASAVGDQAGDAYTNNITGDVVPLETLNTESSPLQEMSIPNQIQEKAIEPVMPEKLYPKQQRAFSIVKWHLIRTLKPNHLTSKEEIPQMLMLLMGEGGMGKSKVIQTITQEFASRGVLHTLVKSAYTGIAASLIDGKTTHQIAGITVGKKDQTLSVEARKRLAVFWKDIRYLIIDECSMLSKEFFAQLSRHIQIAKMEYDPTVFDLPFGGVNVILCGDLHQFPPVAVSSHGALYNPTKPGTSPSQINQAAGRSLYEKFDTVVTLKTQVRVSDIGWRDFLNTLRRGLVKDHHIKMLKDLVLTNPNCKQPDFGSALWRDCVLVTPRHSVRTRWNEAAVERHCRQTGHQLFICPAEMTVMGNNGRRPITIWEKYVIALSRSDGKKSSLGRAENNGLTNKVLLAIGLRVMVTMNVKTDLDVANGACGTISEIILDPNEPYFDPEAASVTLSRLPSHILVKMDRTRASPLPGLQENVLPIVPTSRSFRIVLPIRQKDGSVKTIPRTVHRLQFPITPAYAFTDYRSQGQTIPAAIIDIATPPTGGGLSIYNLYVALSRCAGRDNIRILRDFDEKLLMRSLDYDLLKEDERLAKLDAKTEELWNEIKILNNLSDVSL